MCVCVCVCVYVCFISYITCVGLKMTTKVATSCVNKHLRTQLCLTFSYTVISFINTTGLSKKYSVTLLIREEQWETSWKKEAIPSDSAGNGTQSVEIQQNPYQTLGNYRTPTTWPDTILKHSVFSIWIYSKLSSYPSAVASKTFPKSAT